MTTRITIRLSGAHMATLDAEIAEGRAVNRSDAIRHAIAYLQRRRRYRAEEATLVELARRGETVYPDLAACVDLPTPPLD